MKKHVLLTVLGVALTLPCLALAQHSTTDNAMPPTAQYQRSALTGGAEDSSRFQEHKAEVLKHMTTRIAEMQQRLACVQAAATREALRACMPERHEPPRDAQPQGQTQGGQQQKN